MRSWTLLPLALVLLGAPPAGADSPSTSCAPTATPDEVAALAAPLCGKQEKLSAAEQKCQEALAATSAAYFSARLDEITAGKRATAHGRMLDALGPACANVAIRGGTTGMIPAIGAPCAKSAGKIGEDFDAASAARCVRGTLSGLANRAAPTPLPPNFVVVLTDDQRWDTVPHMPRLRDEIVDRGLSYSTAFVNTPLCGPSRASLLSGHYSQVNGVRGNDAAATSFNETQSIAPPLSAAGYRTGLFGIYMTGVGEKVPPGWDDWYALAEASANEDGFAPLVFRNGEALETLPATKWDEITDTLGEKAAGFIGENANEPFFLWLGTTAPHTPAIPAERHANAFSDLEPARPPSFREPDVTDKPSWVQFFKAVAKPEGAARIDEVRRAQLRSLLGVDDAVGALSDKLEELGLTDDTVFIFTSDNGHFWGEHWLSAKFANYEEAIRVPLAIRFPRRIPAARTADGLALNVDLVDTIADLAGIETNTPGPGVSLVPSFDGASVQRKEILLESPGGFIARPSHALRTDRWKYIVTDADGGILEELYDLQTDPHEMNNLAPHQAHHDVKDAMAKRLTELRTELVGEP